MYHLIYFTMINVKNLSDTVEKCTIKFRNELWRIISEEQEREAVLQGKPSNDEMETDEALETLVRDIALSYILISFKERTDLTKDYCKAEDKEWFEIRAAALDAIFWRWEQYKNEIGYTSIRFSPLWQELEDEGIDIDSLLQK